MKKTDIFWTPFALKALNEVADYIEKESKSKNIAYKYINKLINRVDQLEDFSESGVKEPLLEHLNTNSRFLVEGSYKIIYQYQNHQIIITDVFHVKQNPIKITKRNKKK